MGHYASFADLVIDGAPYLPEYKIEYNQYTKDLLFGIQLQCLIFAMGVVAGQLKEPYAGIPYILISTYGGYAVFSVNSKC
tara:strand:+ start:186 stop:425 length:240 start_codon:yes stop_codon:yes gene_type:complete